MSFTVEKIVFLLKIVCVGVLLMPIIWRTFGSVSRRLLTTMADKYAAGTHSVAYVTVPNETVANEIAG